MFYSQLVLTKKGHLGRLWFAATLGESKIPKQFAYEAKIDILCRSIEQPAAPFALRLSAHLMLGVTRVFSRKSSIVLSDVNQVFAAIHRHHSQVMDESGPSRPKRRASGQISTKSRAISLRTDTDSARFDKITLPARKTRRRSNETGTTGQPEYLLTQDASMDQYGRNPKWFLDNPLQPDANQEIGTNLEMEFPTIDVGSLFDGRSPNAGSQGLLSQSSPRYRAREQDITLPPGSDLAFGSDIPLEVGLDLLDANISLSLSIPPSFSPQPAVDPPNVAEAHRQFKKAFGSSKREPSYQNAPVSVLDPVEAMEPLADPINIVQDGQPQGPAGDAGTSTGGGTGKRRRKRSSTETTSRKSKKTLRILQLPLVSSSQTELTTSHIRECLNDPSDTMLAPGEPRPYKKRRKSEKDTLASLLLAYNPLPAAVGDLWQETVVRPSFQDIGIPVGEVETVARTPITPVAQQNMSGNGGAPPVQEFEMPPLPMLDDNFTLGQSAAVPRAENEGALRSIAGSGRNVPSAPSMPSGSNASGALSIAKSSSAGSKGPEILRDLELENITDADRAAYETAWRISAEFKLAAPSQRNTPSKDGASIEELPGTNAESPSRNQTLTNESGGSKVASDMDLDIVSRPGNVSNEFLPVRDSDLQLEEETEKEPSADAEKGLTVMERLDIRAFKILEILRDLGKEKGIRNSQSLEPITTFDELIRDCSKGTKSRTFLHILALTTLGFIRVEQGRSYGKIDIFAGSFY